MKKTAAGLGAVALASLAFAAKDPVIMTVAGVDVPKSEFEYLYNKNSKQQINPQTLDEYVEMFKLYKMKVADARAEGIDTTSAFIKEIETYRHDLAAPYLADSTFLNSLVHEAYERSKQEVEANHIMFFKSRDAAQNTVLRQRADSLLQALKAGSDFAESASKYSQDRGSKDRGGSMGWITAGRFPLAFEEAAYSLSEGELSGIVETPMGYHILKGGRHREARGKIQAAHILKLTQGKSESEQAKAKAEIDSLYQIIIAQPASFSAIATKNSEDRGSARQGGLLPFFGAGEMVPEFDSIAFSLPDGGISQPFKTAYGYHIVQRLKSQSIPEESEIKAAQLQRMTSPQDPRFNRIRDHQTATLAKKHKGSIDTKTVSEMRTRALENGVDSLFMAWLFTSKMPLASVEGKKYTTADFAETNTAVTIPAGETAAESLDNALANWYNSKLVSAEEKTLEKTEPDYRNLLKEYIDGSMLYEVSVRKVWDRAAQDAEGLTAYFERNRSNYTWTEPHAKGFLVQAANDSVADAIRARAAFVEENKLVQTIRDEFKGQAMIDRVLVSRGTNNMVDNLMFGAQPVTPPNAKYPVYFMINPRVISAPEEVSDVKGLVTSDYQNEFQTNWENELRRKYPVIVNEKVLRSVSRK